MRLKSICLAAVAILVFVHPAQAWNSLGHKAVAEIAWQQLEPSERQSIVDILRRHPRFDVDFQGKMEDTATDKATQDHWIFQQAATWPDIIRKNKTYDRPPWHYINFPIYLDPSDRMAFDKRLAANISTDLSANTPRDQYNVLQAIAFCRATLKGKAGPDVKAAAYCWLFHLVGDLHQPLHSTALFSVNQFPKGDRGGNPSAKKTIVIPADMLAQKVTDALRRLQISILEYRIEDRDVRFVD
jgi:hypothetical protein